MIKQRKERATTIINPASIINPSNHYHQASLHHQPTHQIPKPLIKIIKIIKTIKQRKKTATVIGESSGDRRGNGNWREQRWVRWSVARLWWDSREQWSSGPSKPINQNPKTIKQRKKIAMAIGESSGDRREQRRVKWLVVAPLWRDSREQQRLVEEKRAWGES